MKKTILLLIVFIISINPAKSQVKKDTILTGHNCSVSIITSMIESHPYKVSFIPQTPDSMGRYSWDFGDGTSSFEMYAVHEYVYAGTYPVSVFYKSADSCTAFASDTVYIPGNSACEAKWTYFIDQMPDMSTQPFISFTDESIGNITSWQWELGDSTSASVKNPSKIYSVDGIYNVCLTITTGDNCTSTLCQPVNTRTYDQCNTYGTVKDYTGLDGCGMVIILDDGTRLEPAQIVPDYILKDGERIRFSYTILKDRASICMVGPVVRIDCISPVREDTCFVDFSFFALPWVSSWPALYRFDPIPDMYIKEILWDFGDGTTSTEEIPTHRFPHDGYYTIGMKIKTYMGCEAEIHKTDYFEGYDEQPGLCDNFIKLTTEVILNGFECNGTAIASLVDAVGNQVDASGYSWSTGETTFAISQLCPGTPYHVRITDMNGCAVSGSFYFGNNPSFPDTLIGYWNYEQNACDFVFNLPVFSDSLHCEWDFGDGDKAEGLTVNHTYDSTDNYTVVVSVKDETGTLVYSENIQVTAGNPTAINKTESEPPVVYPVPATDHLNIVLSNRHQVKQIEILTASGQMLQIISDVNQNHNRIEINVSDLLSGFYLGKLRFENGEEQSFRFVK